MKQPVVVLISGSGSNLQALIDQSLEGNLNIDIRAVISNRPGVFGLERAEKAGIPALCLNHKDHDSREAFDAALMRAIDDFSPELVVLAGFMRILTEEFTTHYLGRMLNIHPSLLPKYKGLNTHQRAIEAGDSNHGASVHFVSAELDGGPIVVQASIDIAAEDTSDTLAAKVHKLEHQIYPLAVKWFSEGRLRYQNGIALLNNEPLPPQGYQHQ